MHRYISAFTPTKSTKSITRRFFLLLLFFVFVVEAPRATQAISLGFIKILHDLCSSESNRTEANTWVNQKTA